MTRDLYCRYSDNKNVYTPFYIPPSPFHTTDQTNLVRFQCRRGEGVHIFFIIALFIDIYMYINFQTLVDILCEMEWISIQILRLSTQSHSVWHCKSVILETWHVQPLHLYVCFTVYLLCVLYPVSPGLCRTDLWGGSLRCVFFLFDLQFTPLKWTQMTLEPSQMLSGRNASPPSSTPSPGRGKQRRYSHM